MYDKEKFIDIRDEIEDAFNRAEFQSKMQGFLFDFKEAVRIFGK